MQRAIAIISVFLFSFPVMSQEISHYDIIDGLSSIEVTDIVENENFLWIATCDGLNRFDGENFKVFKRENDGSNCLTENNIETLFFDSDGFLWIGLKTGGVDIYDPRKETFTNISHLTDGKIPSRVISIMEDSEKNIWLGTWEEGLYELIPKANHQQGYSVKVFCNGYIVSGIIEKPKGYIRIGTYFGLFCFDLKTGILKASGQNTDAITQFLDTGDENSLWYSTWSSGIVKMSWDIDNPAFIKECSHFEGHDLKSIHRMIESGDHRILLGTWGEGLKNLDLKNPGSVQPVISKNFTASLINSLFYDKYNNIWVGTYGRGIYRFNPEKNGIGHFPETGKLPDPVTSLASYGENTVLAGTQGHGVFLCNLKTGKMIPKLNNSGNGEFDNYILSLFSDRNMIFAGHDGLGLPYSTHAGFAPGDFSFSEFYADAKLEKVTACYKSDDGRIWIGTKQDGLISVRMDDVSNKPGSYVHYDAFGPDEITGFAKADMNHLFISSHSGLYLFNTGLNKIEKEGRLITNEIIYRIARDEDNNCLWIGTSTNLLKINLDKPDSVYSAFPDDLFPQGAIRVLSKDYYGNLWFAVGERLFCSVNKEKRVKEINPDLLGNHTILSSCCISVNGEKLLVFGTTDNLIIIDPEQVLNQPDESRIIFTGLQVDHKKIGVGEKVYGKVLINEATEYINSIRLSYKCRWISLSFTETGWDFYKNEYQYRIKGFSEKWQYLDLSYPITFSQLNPGEYKIEVRKYDAREDSPVCWSMDMTIVPPWWKTIWFFVFSLLLVLAAAFVTVILLLKYMRRRQKQRLMAVEKKKEDELLREKESFFTGLSHDLLTPFSLILAPVNDLVRESDPDDPKREKLEIIRKNTSFLSDIFGTILDFKRAELSDIQLKETKVEIVSFTRIVVNAFDYLAKSRKISLNFESGIKSLTILTDNVKIERIMYNLLSNAIKYTPDGGSVNIEMQYQKTGHLLLSVRDNGCGIDIKNQTLIFEKFYREPEKAERRDSHGLGLGLYVVKKFAELLDGEVSVESSPGSGTKILVRLPVTVIKPGTDKNEGETVADISEDRTTILLVEDNDQMREYLREKLCGTFNVITAGDGSEALDCLEEYLPEIIISDIMMPGIDGLTLCRQIKANIRYADIFVVLLTAKTSSEDELNGYKGGADIYIKKPFDSEALLSQLINIQNTRKNRKSQLFLNLVSKEDTEIEFDSKETFLKRSMQIIEDHIMDANFKIDEFAAEMNLSKTVLHRKFKVLVGQTPSQFIRLVRLRKSVNLLRNSDHTIAEIAYLTGFNQSHYFIKCFREVYDETPKSFRQKSNA
jgi:signal transduction histidine kinase/DNA-binding response OmpR family regulator/ligand-binding sensor domain-containing protein